MLVYLRDLLQGLDCDTSTIIPSENIPGQKLNFKSSLTTKTIAGYNSPLAYFVQHNKRSRDDITKELRIYSEDYNEGFIIDPIVKPKSVMTAFGLSNDSFVKNTGRRRDQFITVQTPLTKKL